MLKENVSIILTMFSILYYIGKPAKCKQISFIINIPKNGSLKKKVFSENYKVFFFNWNMKYYNYFFYWPMVTSDFTI